MSNPADPRFRGVETQYAALKAQLSAGQMTREQFEAALQAQMILDAQGRYWMIGAESGRWYMHDGQNWVQQDPPSATPTPPPSAPTPDEHRAARQDAVTLASFILPQVPPKPQPSETLLRPDQAQTLVGFTPPVIPPKTQQPTPPPAARPDAQTMVGFTPPTVPPQVSQTPPPSTPPQAGQSAPAATPPSAAAPRRGGLPPVLIMAVIFLFVCVAGVLALAWAIQSRFAPDQPPAATTAATAVAAATATATSVPPTTALTTPTSVPTTAPTKSLVSTIVPVIPTVSIARPTATNTPPATATVRPPPATPTPEPPTATATNPPPAPPTRTPTPQFGFTFAFQGYADWGRPDINNPATYCTTFNNGFRWRQFVWDAFVTNRSATTLNPSEWTSTAYTDQGVETRVCASNLPAIPVGQTLKSTFVAYVEQGRFIQRIVHTVRGAATQRCLDSSWKETGC